MGRSVREKHRWGNVVLSISSPFIAIYCPAGGMVWLQGSLFSPRTWNTFLPLAILLPDFPRGLGLHFTVGEARDTAQAGI